MTDIKELLDSEAARINSPEFIGADPVQFPRRFEALPDIEIAALLSATIASSTCMRADAMATACMVLGSEDALDMIERAGDAACYLIVAENDSLTVLTSQNWADFIKK